MAKLFDLVGSLFRSVIDWIKEAIRICWNTFLVLFAAVITVAGVIIKGIKLLINKCLNGISNLAQKIKSKIIRFFVVRTPKDPFKNAIEDAQKSGKYGTVDVNLGGDYSYTSEDVHIVQTDEDFNTQNVYTVSSDKFGSDFKNKFNEEITEVNLSL